MQNCLYKIQYLAQQHYSLDDAKRTITTTIQQDEDTYQCRFPIPLRHNSINEKRKLTQKRQSTVPSCCIEPQHINETIDNITPPNREYQLEFHRVEGHQSRSYEETTIITDAITKLRTIESISAVNIIPMVKPKMNKIRLKSLDNELVRKYSRQCNDGGVCNEDFVKAVKSAINKKINIKAFDGY